MNNKNISDTADFYYGICDLCPVITLVIRLCVGKVKHAHARGVRIVWHSQPQLGQPVGLDSSARGLIQRAGCARLLISEINRLRGRDKMLVRALINYFSRLLIS